MNLRRLPASALYAGSCLLCFGIGRAFADDKQSKSAGMIYQTGNPADWPKEKDAVIAASRNHKVLLENDRVRVLDVTLAPGEVEAVHSHRLAERAVHPDRR